MRTKIPEARTSPPKGIPFRPLKALEILPHTLPPSCQLPPHTFYSFLSKNCMMRSDTASGTSLLPTCNKHECQTLPVSCPSCHQPGAILKLLRGGRPYPCVRALGVKAFHIYRSEVSSLSPSSAQSSIQKRRGRMSDGEKTKESRQRVS